MVDLLARIPGDAVPDGGSIRDLGCGHGRLTAMLADRWPTASVVGVDSSAGMLTTARRDHDRDAITWLHTDMLTTPGDVGAQRQNAGSSDRERRRSPEPEPGDVGAQRQNAGSSDRERRRSPEPEPDLLVSNAALHWVDDHRTVFPRLLSWLAPGGTLAVQMPRNHDAPTHRIIADLVLDDRWRDRLQPVLRPFPVAPATWLHDLLRPLTATLDVWETTYLHALTGDDPVLEWVSGSVLRPLLAALDTDAERDDFTTLAAKRYRVAYPSSPDGTTLLPFTRQFLLATSTTTNAGSPGPPAADGTSTR